MTDSVKRYEYLDPNHKCHCRNATKEDEKAHQDEGNVAFGSLSVMREFVISMIMERGLVRTLYLTLRLLVLL